MGSGKTYWGKQLAGRLQVPFFDLDSVIATTEQKNISQIFTEYGEEFFRYREKETLEEIVNDHEEFILSCGGGTPCFFNNIDYMKKKGTVVWLNTSINVLRDRLLSERTTRPLIKAIGDAELKNYIVRKLGERKMYYEKADVVINEENASIPAILGLLGHA